MEFTTISTTTITTSQQQLLLSLLLPPQLLQLTQSKEPLINTTNSIYPFCMTSGSVSLRVKHKLRLTQLICQFNPCFQLDLLNKLFDFDLTQKLNNEYH